MTVARATEILVAFVAVTHVYFMILEMFYWTKPKGLRIFGQTLEQARASATLAANQGLYNGFLAAGLFWGLMHAVPEFGRQIECFFLLCVSVAGMYGGLSVNRKIFYVQALPALLTLSLLLGT